LTEDGRPGRWGPASDRLARHGTRDAARSKRVVARRQFEPGLNGRGIGDALLQLRRLGKLLGRRPGPSAHLRSERLLKAKPRIAGLDLSCRKQDGLSHRSAATAAAVKVCHVVWRILTDRRDYRPAARRDILRRLLALNLEIAAKGAGKRER